MTGRRILVVEDEFFIADDIQAALAANGADVLGPVPSCAEALAIIEREERIAAAVLDIDLGGELAFPIAGALTERGVPFLFATGYEQAIIPAQFRTVPRWEKPYDLSAVVSAVAEIIRSIDPGS